MENERRRQHHHTWKGGYSPTYGSWQSMIQRCTNPESDQWPRYGGRGVVVCERWQDFRAFLADMGERPDGMTLDRIDNDGHYESGNCRWATATEQAANKTHAWNDGPNGRRRVLDREKCKRGHVLAEVGVYVRGQTAPTCKACAKENQRAYVTSDEGRRRARDRQRRYAARKRAEGRP